MPGESIIQNNPVPTSVLLHSPVDNLPLHRARSRSSNSSHHHHGFRLGPEEEKTTRPHNSLEIFRVDFTEARSCFFWHAFQEPNSGNPYVDGFCGLVLTILSSGTLLKFA